jgi:hypothetical protein
MFRIIRCANENISFSFQVVPYMSSDTILQFAARAKLATSSTKEQTFAELTLSVSRAR